MNGAPPPLPDRSRVARPPEPKSGMRRLLLVYIHGFMGSEASFHDLPAHVHDSLTTVLAGSHIVYTRIYPRYKSHGEVQEAVDQFSNWLAPHEADDLDVILLGHSLGGIVAADVALQQVDGHARNRILGLVNFDVPFLGLHPRVIPTGIGSSIPKKDVTVEDGLAGEQESLGLEPAFKPARSPNFDPAFQNDVRLVDRGFFKGVLNFVNKNKNNLPRSVFDRFASTFRFAGCVNNYSELRQRYRRLKALEAAEGNPQRVRFINYYTASTGRKSQKEDAKHENVATEADDASAIPDDATKTGESAGTPSEKTGLTEESTELKAHDQPTESDRKKNQIPETSLQHEKETGDESEHQKQPDISATSEELEREGSNATSIPVEPQTGNNSSLDLTSTTSSMSTDQKESIMPSENISLTTTESTVSANKTEGKYRKFILLPSHHWSYDDNAYWTPLVMKNIDEVEAHQTIFNTSGKHYEYLVGDLVALIENWVQDDLTRRLLEESNDY